jgi:glycosyltransferase involved in cell wall biosynthesis
MTSSLTILQLLPSLDTGGAERTAIDISKALCDAGHRAIVASAGGRLTGELLATGAEHVEMPLDSKNPLTMFANAGRLARLIQAEKVDIVHARSRAPAWSALLASRRTGVPLVTTYHGIYSEKGWFKRLYNSVMARADRIIANSHYTADLIAARYGTDKAKIQVIYRGTDLGEFQRERIGDQRLDALRQQWKIGDDDRIVLNVARLTSWKGQQVLIEAACRPPLKERGDVVFVLAGDDQGRSGYRRQLQSLIDERNAAERIRMVGHCADVAAAMALADVSVVASTSPEAFGRAAVESQALGVPVVVTALGAVPETVLAPPQVEAGLRTGWHVPPHDADALGAAIDHALSLGAAEKKALSVRAKAQAANFSLSAMADQTLALYRSLAGS